MSAKSPKPTLSASDIAQFRELAGQGLNMSRIAEAMAMDSRYLHNQVRRGGEMYHIWKRNHSTRFEAARGRRRKFMREYRKQNYVPRPDPGGGPIAPELLEAAEVVRTYQSMKTKAEILLAACAKRVDVNNCICVGEIAEELDWTSEQGYRVARWLVDRGTFPYRFKARHVEPVDEDSDIPAFDVDGLYVDARTARETQLEHDDRDERRTGVLTPAYERITRYERPEVLENSPEVIRANVAKYVAEWRKWRRQRPVPKTPEQILAEKAARRIELHRIHSAAWNKRNPEKVAERKRRWLEKRKQQQQQVA